MVVDFDLVLVVVPGIDLSAYMENLDPFVQSDGKNLLVQEKRVDCPELAIQSVFQLILIFWLSLESLH